MTFQRLNTFEDLNDHGYEPFYPFADLHWIAAWKKHLSNSSDSIQYVQKQNVSVILPVLTHQRIYSCMELIGEGLFDYQDILVKGDYQPVLLKYFQDTKMDAFEFKRLREDSHLWMFLQSFQGQLNGLSQIVSPSSQAPYVKVQGLWTEYLSTLRKKFVADTHRQMKRLSSLGRFSFEICKDQTSVQELTQVLFEQHRDRRKILGQNKSIFENAVYRDFLLDLNGRLLTSGNLFLCSLRLDNRVIAVAECFIYNRSLFYYLPAFEESYKSYSPGNVLLYYILQYAFENQLKEVDLMAGQEEYKFNWNAQTRRTYHVAIYQKSFRGSLAKAHRVFLDGMGTFKTALVNSPLKKFKQNLFRMYYRNAESN